MRSEKEFEAQLDYLISMLEQVDEMILDLHVDLIKFHKKINNEFADLSKQLFAIEESIKSSWR